ncbi:MAG: ATP-binding cassette protein [Frankiales bacterium]|nr:ATP-binding cassette protein [Frankiales bacterium]
MTAPLDDADGGPGVATAPGQALVHCAAVTRTYGTGRQAVPAVCQVTATVRPGARIALTGPSGSGKSTLLHLMAGLEPPTSGSVRWPGLGGSPAGRPGVVGMVFQGPSLVPALDVLENVALPLLLAGANADDATERAHAALERLAIPELATKLPEEISGGQAQRVAVARVLASRPLLILADEPTGQLDSETGARVVSVLLETADELDATLVVATHDQEIADRLTDRWEMADGRLTAAVQTW